MTRLSQLISNVEWNPSSILKPRYQSNGGVKYDDCRTRIKEISNQSKVQQSPSLHEFSQVLFSLAVKTRSVLINLRIMIGC